MIDPELKVDFQKDNTELLSSYFGTSHINYDFFTTPANRNPWLNFACSEFIPEGTYEFVIADCHFAKAKVTLDSTDGVLFYYVSDDYQFHYIR